MRTSIALIALSLAVAAPARGRDLHMPKMSAAELKATCDKVGGKFSQDAQHYGCGTDCQGGAGTDCIVACSTDETCIAQDVGGRRPHTVADALTAPKRR